jgi:hypothetical protein
MGLPIMGIPFARSNDLADVKAKNDLYLSSIAAPVTMRRRK